MIFLPKSYQGMTHEQYAYDVGKFITLFILRSSVCERPRTYDKFYRKGPSNFQGGIGEKSHQSNNGTNGCSSEEDKEDIPRVSGGGSQRARRKKKRRGSEKLQYSRTITEKDVRSIERHLSMKKTIRKKIMRDLQQAFVDGDPNEISANAEAINTEQQYEKDLKTINIATKQNSKSDPNFLDMLRGDESNNAKNEYSDDSGHCSGPSPTLPPTYNHMRGTRLNINPASNAIPPRRPAKRYNFISDSGGSSCGGDESLENVVGHDDNEEDIIVVAAEQIEACVIDDRMIHPANYQNHEVNFKNSNSKYHLQNKNSNYMNSYLEGKTIFSASNHENVTERNYVNIQPISNNVQNNEHSEALIKNKSSNGKKTFWQKLTGGGNCSGSKNRDSSKRVIK